MSVGRADPVGQVLNRTSEGSITIIMSIEIGWRGKEVRLGQLRIHLFHVDYKCRLQHAPRAWRCYNNHADDANGGIFEDFIQFGAFDALRNPLFRSG